MTRDEAVALAERIEEWQERLEFLGIGHWRIDSVNIVDEAPGEPGAHASVVPHSYYDTCTFYFKNGWVDEATPQQVDETIVHEWVHVFMRDLDEAIEAVEEMLGSVAGQVWNDRVTHEREGVVDRLSRQLYALATSPKQK